MPDISTAAHESGTFIFIMVDPDYNTTVPTNTVLHTIVGNLTSASTASGSPAAYALTTPSAPLASYIGPQPPKTGPPHHYTGLLFLQPPNFAVPSKYASFLPLNPANPLTRTNFPILDFVLDTGLSNLNAATFWEVSGIATTATAAKTQMPAENASSSAVASNSPTATSSVIPNASPSATPAAGAAVRFGMSQWLAPVLYMVGAWLVVW